MSGMETSVVGDREVPPCGFHHSDMPPLPEADIEEQMGHAAKVLAEELGGHVRICLAVSDAGPVQYAIHSRALRAEAFGPSLFDAVRMFRANYPKETPP